jgi:hypothetical protein
MSESLKIVIVEASNGQVIERSMTEDEIAELEVLSTKTQAALDSSEALRQSALAKLAALGLTEEEIAAL